MLRPGFLRFHTSLKPKYRSRPKFEPTNRLLGFWAKSRSKNRLLGLWSFFGDAARDEAYTLQIQRYIGLAIKYTKESQPAKVTQALTDARNAASKIADPTVQKKSLETIEKTASSLGNPTALAQIERNLVSGGYSLMEALPEFEAGITDPAQKDAYRRARKNCPPDSQPFAEKVKENWFAWYCKRANGELFCPPPYVKQDTTGCNLVTQSVLVIKKEVPAAAPPPVVSTKPTEVPIASSIPLIEEPKHEFNPRLIAAIGGGVIILALVARKVMSDD